MNRDRASEKGIIATSRVPNGNYQPVWTTIVHALDTLRRATMVTTELNIAPSETVLLAAAARPASVGAQTAAFANAQMGSLAQAQVSSQRVGGAMENYMYIGLGTVVIIIILFLILR